MRLNSRLPSDWAIRRTEVWRVRVLEFVLERRRFYSRVVNATIRVKNRVFLSKSIISRNEKERSEMDDFGILSLARLPNHG